MRRTSWRTTWGRLTFLNWRLFRSFENHEKQDLLKKVRRIGGAYPQIETERVLHDETVKPTRVLHESYTNPARILHESHTNPPQILHESDTNPTRILHEPYTTNPTRNPRESYTNPTRVAGAHRWRTTVAKPHIYIYIYIYICSAYLGAQPSGTRSIYIIIKIRGHIVKQHVVIVVLISGPESP